MPSGSNGPSARLAAYVARITRSPGRTATGPITSGAITLRSITGDGVVTRRPSAIAGSTSVRSAASRGSQPLSASSAMSLGMYDTIVSVPVRTNAATAPIASSSVRPSERIRPGTVDSSPSR